MVRRFTLRFSMIGRTDLRLSMVRLMVSEMVVNSLFTLLLVGSQLLVSRDHCHLIKDHKFKIPKYCLN